MRFSDFSDYLQKMENTQKRLEISSLLSEMILKLDLEETDKAIYLSLGYLKAQYESEKFNMAEKMVIKALDKTFPGNDSERLYKELGDLGDVAQRINPREGLSDLDILAVHKYLMDMAQAQGSGSQDLKINKLSDLLKKLDKLSSKYVIRIILGTTRLGFTELSIIDALSNYLVQDKTLKTKIEDKYFIHPDIGRITKILKKRDMRELEDISIETGIPILPQKAQRLGDVEEIVEKLGDCWAEYKFDGTRVQLHLDRTKHTSNITSQTELFVSPQEEILIKTYTRNLEDSTHQFPDIAKAAEAQLDAESVILDGEALGIDKNTGEFLPFQQIMQRKRKHAVKEFASEIPIVYFAFDILYLNGKSLMDKPLSERNAILTKIVKPGKVIKVAEHLETTSADEVNDFFDEAKSMNLEGLIIKKPNDSYQAGARSFSWVKLKKADEKLLDDSLDVVVLGYFAGKGERSKFGIGKVLVGIYDEKEDKYKTITKVGTGFKDEDFIYFKKTADKFKIAEVPNNVVIGKMYMPDVIVSPKMVLEIGGDEISVSKTHSAGFALRFPRLLYFRADKNPSQCTTLKEVETLFSLQKRGNYTK